AAATVRRRPRSPAAQAGPRLRRSHGCAHHSTLRLHLASFAAAQQTSPAAHVDVHAEGARGGADAPPGAVALRVGDALDLIESSNRVAHVPRVGQWLLALLREGEPAFREPVSAACREPLGALRDARAGTAGLLGADRLADVPPGGGLLPGSRHVCFLQNLQIHYNNMASLGAGRRNARRTRLSAGQ